MTALRNIRMLTRYTAWANDCLFEALCGLPAGEAVKPRATLFGNMVHTMNHCYVIDLIWQAHLEGRPHGFTKRNTDASPPLLELREAQRQMDQWYIEYANGLSEQALDEVVKFTFIGGGPGAMTRGDMLHHVVSHKSYHRGWVADMFFQVPARPPTMDLPVFLRDVPQ
jgi:uncharacterized damage-inducible protein DinB